MMCSLQQRGFTLLEVLVAVVLFSVASALAYGGMMSLVRAQEQSAALDERLGRLQFAMGMIERDVASAAPRGIRDEFGAPKPAFDGGISSVEMTRFGYSNRLSLPRAELERVSYVKRDKRVVRLRWAVLDRAPSSKPMEDVLLENVEDFSLHYLDAQGREHRQWPPPRGSEEQFPKALRLTLNIDGFGEVERLLELPMEPNL